MYDLYGLIGAGVLVVVLLYVTYTRKLKQQLRVAFLYGFLGGALFGVVLGVCVTSFFPGSSYASPAPAPAPDATATATADADADEELLRIFGGRAKPKTRSNYDDQNFTYWFGTDGVGGGERVGKRGRFTSKLPPHDGLAPKSSLHGLCVTWLRNLWVEHGKHAAGILGELRGC
jgi:hypothetical protein